MLGFLLEPLIFGNSPLPKHSGSKAQNRGDTRNAVRRILVFIFCYTVLYYTMLLYGGFHE